MAAEKPLSALLVLTISYLFLQDVVFADCDVCDLNSAGDVVESFKNISLADINNGQDTVQIFQLLKEKYGQDSFDEYEKILQAYVDRQIKEKVSESSVNSLEMVFQFLVSLCKKKSGKHGSAAQKQIYLEELINEIVSAKFQHLVNSTADKINGLQKNLNAKLAKIDPSTVEMLADEQRVEDVKNFEIDFQISEQQVAIRKYNRLFQLLGAKNLPQSVSLLATGTYYYHVASAIPWKDAKVFCEKYGMELVTLDTKAELETVVKAIPASNRASCFYTAGSDLVARPGMYFWINGRREEVNASLWYPAKPNAYVIGRETCVYVKQSEGYYLSDTVCTTNCHLICKTTPYT